MTIPDASSAHRSSWRFGSFELHPEDRRLLDEGEPVTLGARAFDLLLALVRHAGLLVSKDRLLAEAWPGLVVEENNLQVQISALRKILGAEAIATVPGHGYRFVLGTTYEGAAPPTVTVTPKHNLPQQLTSFIGREKEIAEVQALLHKTRLLTLTGSGGCGKTRLSLQIATGSIEQFPDGVWLIELAPLSEPGLVVQAVAMVLGPKEHIGRQSIQTLTAHLQDKRLMLLLDNCEHLLAACAQLADVVLRQCPQVVLLVTSREGLEIAGELTYRLPSLSVPDPNRDTTPDSLSVYDSVRLFIDRAQFQLPHFTVTMQNASALASLCFHLDGIPLAIELAAARVRSMSVEEVNRRLDERFRLLTKGSRTALPRHRTLRSLIDWSYDLLGDAEKALFERLSVFSGGWTVDASERVCLGDGIDVLDVLDLLTSLVDKSLIWTEDHGGATRYGMLETVRQYATERLEETGKTMHSRERHLAYCVAIADEAELHYSGAERQVWLNRLDLEHDNLRSALAWCCTLGEHAVNGLRLSGALWRFWSVRGYQSEGRTWLSALLDATPLSRNDARANALHGSAALAWQQGDYAIARTLSEESLAIRREIGDRQGIADSLHGLGIVANLYGDYSTARAHYEESLVMCRELGNSKGVAVRLINLASMEISQGNYASAEAKAQQALDISLKLNDRQNVASSIGTLGAVARDLGDLSASEALHQESLEIYQELGYRRAIANAIHNLGIVAYLKGDFAKARALFNESLCIRQELGDRWGISASLDILGSVESDVGDYQAARTLHAESLTIRRGLGDRLGIAWSLEGLSRVAFCSAKPYQAIRLWGAAARLREEIGAPLPSRQFARYDGEIAAARAVLGDDAVFEHAWQQGSAMTLEQAIEFALRAHP